MKLILWILFVLTCLHYSYSQITQQCLDCICQASTGCDLSRKCHNAGGNAYFCGPYQITWAYWADGGKPGYSGHPHDFETCLNNKQCAEQAIMGYMSKWETDCNGDGVIDCLDYAAIHKAGPGNCNADWVRNTDYWKALQRSQCVASDSSLEPVIKPETPAPAQPVVPVEPIADESCLECICIASSNCDLNKQCSGSYCGPYLISWAYWADGGKPGSDYVSCALDKSCAERALQGYMNKWKRDCNGDGVIDCDDFASIHKLGPHACGSTVLSSGKYWNQYKQCSAPAIDARRKPLPGASLGPRLPSNTAERVSESNIRDYSSPWIPSLPASPNEIAYSVPYDRDYSQPRFIPFHETDENTNPRYSFYSTNNEPLNRNRSTENSPNYTPLRSNPPLSPGFLPISTYNPRPPNYDPYPNPRSNSPASETFDTDYRSVEHSNEPSFRGSSVRSSSPNDNSEPESYARDTFTENNDGTNRDTNEDYPRGDEYSRNADPYRPINPSLPAVNAANTTTAQPSLPPVHYSSGREARNYIGPSKNTMDMQQDCMECICEASSKCDINAPCQYIGNEQYCGPYQISLAYWRQAGQPGYTGSSSDFENCASDKECSEDAVKNYINSMNHDCNGDGLIDCLDYAAIHKLGAESCQQQAFLDSYYWSEFQQCYGFGK